MDELFIMGSIIMKLPTDLSPVVFADCMSLLKSSEVNDELRLLFNCESSTGIL